MSENEEECQRILIWECLRIGVLGNTVVNLS
jgi:hypothetical protein